MPGVAVVNHASNDTPEYKVGETVKGNDGTEFQYVHASAAIEVYDCVGIDESGEVAPITKAMADDGFAVGFAQVLFADNDYGWVALRGRGSNFKCNVLASCAADVALYTSGTAGALDDSSSGTTKIDGVVLVTTNASSGQSPGAVIATFPKSTTF
jgi:hypothetical protein